MPESDKLLTALSRIIRKRREEVGMSQTVLAEKSGLHRTYINNIERGSKNISIESLKKIADSLSTTVSDLLTQAEEVSSESESPIKILLVEDNPADVFMFKRCIKKSSLDTAVTVIDSGSRAEEYLKSLTTESSESHPDIVFLDLNLPGRTGHELLKDIKSNEMLRHIPVIILTTSANPKDVRKSFGEFSNSFLTKPVDPVEYEKAIHDVLLYWFSVSSIPSKH
ncbi:MAG: response regulator [Cyanobacteriota/Melainabacteria group bacterium]|nr:response regulator [Cyanobacteria bacterium HKST-UBA01]